MSEFAPVNRDDAEHGKVYYLASHVDSHLALVLDTLESRERNIETILEESARRQTEIERLNAIVRRAQQESELIQHNGKTVAVVPHWFLKA